MTEQEMAEIIAGLAQEIAQVEARLVPIWAPEYVKNIIDQEEFGYFTECKFVAHIQEGVFLAAYECSGLHLSLSFHRDNQYWGCLAVSPKGEIEVDESLEAVGAQWLPFFRRNCWLSGYPIECTAHEELEWTQSFQEQQRGIGIR